MLNSYLQMASLLVVACLFGGCAVLAIGFIQCSMDGFRDVDHGGCSRVADASDQPRH